MTTQHTPGPWRVTDDGLFVVAGKENPFNPPPCIACSPSPGQWRTVDARLIAAAPELLAALQVVLLDYQYCDDAVKGLWSDNMVLARAAIAKATGRGE